MIVPFPAGIPLITAKRPVKMTAILIVQPAIGHPIYHGRERLIFRQRAAITPPGMPPRSLPVPTAAATQAEGRGGVRDKDRDRGVDALLRQFRFIQTPAVLFPDHGQEHGEAALKPPPIRKSAVPAVPGEHAGSRPSASSKSPDPSRFSRPARPCSRPTSRAALKSDPSRRPGRIGEEVLPAIPDRNKEKDHPEGVPGTRNRMPFRLPSRTVCKRSQRPEPSFLSTDKPARTWRFNNLRPRCFCGTVLQSARTGPGPTQSRDGVGSGNPTRPRGILRMSQGSTRDRRSDDLSMTPLGSGVPAHARMSMTVGRVPASKRHRWYPPPPHGHDLQTRPSDAIAFHQDARSLVWSAPCPGKRACPRKRDRL